MSEKKKIKMSNPIKGVVSGELLFKTGVVQNLPFLLYVTLLMILYIAYGYYVDGTVHKYSREEKRSEELYSELQSLMEVYDQESLQSKIATDVKPLGLYESKYPPKVVWSDKK